MNQNDKSYQNDTITGHLIQKLKIRHYRKIGAGTSAIQGRLFVRVVSITADSGLKLTNSTASRRGTRKDASRCCRPNYNQDNSFVVNVLELIIRPPRVFWIPSHRPFLFCVWLGHANVLKQPCLHGLYKEVNSLLVVSREL